jgi:dTDP-4-amino-4,6-dideoxygalactose transaminase
MNYITLLPAFSPFILSKKKKKIAEIFLNEKNVYFFQLGRMALKFGLESLNISQGDRILIPSYICVDVTKTIKDACIGIDYYQILNDLTPDFRDIETKITSKTKAILMVHYFGFPQPVEKFQDICKKYNLKLIEDCAHTFGGKYLNKYLGTFGDIAFFSLRKIFALPDGGVLITPKDIPFAYASRTKIALRPVASLFLDWLIFSTGWVWLNFLRKITIINKNKPTGKKNNSICNMSSFSKWLWQYYDLDKVAQKRRNNYLYLTNLLVMSIKFKLLYPELAEGIIPYALPIITENETIKEELCKNGILASRWPALPHELTPKEYKTAFCLAKNILCLPIHQRVNKRKLKFIAELVLKKHK